MDQSSPSDKGIEHDGSQLFRHDSVQENPTLKYFKEASLLKPHAPQEGLLKPSHKRKTVNTTTLPQSRTHTIADVSQRIETSPNLHQDITIDHLQLRHVEEELEAKTLVR
jgi:hypothetical protein